MRASKTWQALALFVLLSGCRSAETQERIDNHLNQAQAYIEQSRQTGNSYYDRAYQQSQLALELDDGNPKAWAIAGWCLFYLRRYGPVEAPDKNAYETFRAALDRLGDDPRLWYGLASVRQKRLMRAEKDHAALTEIVKVADTLRGAARDPSRISEAEAQPRLKRLQENLAFFADPEKRYPMLFVTEAALMEVVTAPAKLLEQARRAEERSDGEAHPFDDRPWWVLVDEALWDRLIGLEWRAGAEGDVALALDGLAQAMREGQTEDRLRWLEGFIAREAEGVREACAALLADNETFINAWHLLGQLAVVLRLCPPTRTDQAARHALAEEGIAAFERYLALHQELFARLESDHEARRQAVFNTPNILARSAIAHEGSLMEESLEDLREKKVEVLFTLADLYDEEGRFADAERCFSAIERDRPGDARLFLRRGALAMRRKRYEKAIADFKACRQHASSLSEVFQVASVKLKQAIVAYRTDLRCRSISGDVKARLGEREVTLKNDALLPSGVKLQTMPGARAEIRVLGEGTIALPPASTVIIHEVVALEGLGGLIRIAIECESGAARLSFAQGSWDLPKSGKRLTAYLTPLFDDWLRLEVDVDGDGVTDERLENRPVAQETPPAKGAEASRP